MPFFQHRAKNPENPSIFFAKHVITFRKPGLPEQIH